MNCLLAHPTGNNFVRETAVGLHASGQLMELHLSIAACGGNLFDQLSRFPGMSELARRRYPDGLRSMLRLHPGREVGRLLAQRMGWRGLLMHEAGWASIDACYQYFDQTVANRLNASHQIDCVYAYEDGARDTFAAALKQGLRRVYDLPIVHWQMSRQIMQEEAERMPAWRPTLTAVFDSREKCARKDEELAMADCVICPSPFVANSLPRYIREQKAVHVIPFGSPQISAPSIRSAANRKLRILFAGSMSQRKGLGDLMAAMRLLDPAQFELHVLGAPMAPMAFYRQECPDFIHHGPCPHEQVLELMKSCDVFALPSLVEGRALVQQEALSCGLPIIVTGNAGASDLVEDGTAGFLVPIRSPEKIAEKLQLLRQDPDLLASMQEAAPAKAASVSWGAYRERIAEAVSAT